MSGIENLKSYTKDRRMSIQEIYNSFNNLDKKIWKKVVIREQEFHTNRKKPKLPILAFTTRKKGQALWLIAGIHGEEPAGPNALSKNTFFLNNLAKKIPIVLLPLCNPVGYVLNWRYPDRKKRPRDPNQRVGSVGNSEHFLLNEKGFARAEKPVNEDASALTFFVLNCIKDYPPILVLDFHEDESSSSGYIYSQGKLGEKDAIAKEIIKLLVDKGFKIKMKGKTSFGEKIHNGVVGAVKDGSIDEFLAASEIIVGGKKMNKQGANSVIVVETNTKKFPLQYRIEMHEEILKRSEKFFNLAKNYF